MVTDMIWTASNGCVLCDVSCSPSCLVSCGKCSALYPRGTVASTRLIPYLPRSQ